VIELCNVRLIDGVSSHNAFAFYLDSTNLGISAPYGSVSNAFVKSVCNPVIPPAPMQARSQVEAMGAIAPPIPNVPQKIFRSIKLLMSN